ncbi:MAG: 3-isopropylmalate dehydratase large subunit, partial [Thermodesulfobacteriota bacterium]|nr:3-isopropylmalate dehydratase large subunit [Thermodesulfobacteriota bacterium]
MAMTITEKILASHSEKGKIYPGELIEVEVDLILANDITAPIAIRTFKEIGAKKVFDKGKIAFVLDHFTPNKDIASAMQCKNVKEFAEEQHIEHFYEGGKAGVEHVLLHELGLAVPGEIIIGADSHTCTYGAIGAFSTGMGSTDIGAAMVEGQTWLKVPESKKFIYYGNLLPWVGGKDLILYTIGDIGVDGALYCSMEFTGETISTLSLADRFTMCNMAIEGGGKNGIIAPDEIAFSYLKGRVKKDYNVYRSDPDASYSEIREYDVSGIEPQIALPHLPENTKSVRELDHIKLDQVVIGSCTNGRIEDLRIAAGILKNRKSSKNLRLIIIPATPGVYKEALSEGLIEIFLEAGAIISPPTCGPCLGGYMGILAEGEKALSTTNRNFVGRMGHTNSEVYLSNPAVAAASAVTGRIVHPDEIG